MSGLAQNSRPPATEKAVEREASNWKEVSSKEGRFAATFPGVAKEESQTIGGQFTLKTFRLSTFAEYSVMYADYPEWANDNDPRVAKTILDNGLAGAVQEVKSKLLEVEEVALDGHPGRRYKERMPDGSILRGKTFLVGHRLYQLAVTTPKEEGAAVNDINFYESVARKFLESFRLAAP